MNALRKLDRLFAVAVVAACCCGPAVRAADPPPAAPDPIEGKWWGTAGFPTDRIELGLEFRRETDGKLHMYVTTPEVAYFDFDLQQGLVEREGDRYVMLGGALLSATIEHGALVGTYFPLKAPMELHRTDRLPREAPVPDLPKGPGPKWRAMLGGAIYAPAAIRDGVAYVGTTGGVMNAIRTGDGKFVWMFAAGRPVFGEALATDDALFFVCDNGYLFKLDRKTGKELWRYDLGDARVPRILEHQILAKEGIGEFDWDKQAPRPMLVDGVLYVGAGDGGFHAVDAATGRQVWRFQAKGALRTDAIQDGARVVFGSMDGILYSLDRATGKEIWEKPTGAAITGAEALAGGRLIFGNRGGLVAALEPATGKVLWRMLLWGSSVESSPVAVDGDRFLIGSSDMRRVQLIDAKDGGVVWRSDVYGWAWPRPLPAGDRVYASAAGAEPYQVRVVGGLSALDRATGKTLWRWPMAAVSGSWMNGFVAAPAIDGSTVVVGGLDGSLYGFEEKR